MRSPRSTIVPRAFMKLSRNQAARDSRLTRRIASIAKRATSRIRRKTSLGCHRKAAAVRIIRTCKRQSVKRAFLLACVASLALSACGSVGSSLGTDQASSAPQSSQAESFGDYLSARLAASDHNMADAARLYAASLAADPDNVDILSHAFLYAAAAGDVATAAKLADRVAQKEPDNRAARLALAVAAIAKGDYAKARSDLSQSAKGAFTELTLVLLDAWAAAGSGDLKSADADLAQVVTQGGTEALARFHRALTDDLAGDRE